MIAPVLISFLLVVLFVGTAIRINHELPESISSLVYELPAGGWQWLWSIWLWAVTLLLASALLDAMPSSYRFIGFLMLVCLMFVGVLPLFDTEHRIWHNVLGIWAGLLSQVCVCIISPYFLFFWIFMVGIYIDKSLRKLTFAEWYTGKELMIAELICATTTYLAVLYPL